MILTTWCRAEQWLVIGSSGTQQVRYFGPNGSCFAIACLFLSRSMPSVTLRSYCLVKQQILSKNDTYSCVVGKMILFRCRPPQARVHLYFVFIIQSKFCKITYLHPIRSYKETVPWLTIEIPLPTYATVVLSVWFVQPYPDPRSKTRKFSHKTYVRDCATPSGTGGQYAASADSYSCS